MPTMPQILRAKPPMSGQYCSNINWACDVAPSQRSPNEGPETDDMCNRVICKQATILPIVPFPFGYR